MRDDHIDGLVAMARANREPEKPESIARLILIAAFWALALGGSITLIVDTVVSVQQDAAATRDFKG
jgi:hypothetical protein